MKTIIVDDEIDACEGIQLLLSNETDIQIVSICRNGTEAIAAINRHKPDLVFLDIQMPGPNGFEVLEQLESDTRPAIIFITAYDEYALDAFEVHALDYVQKPFTDERFYKALHYARQRIETKQPSPVQILNLAEERDQTPAEKLKIKASGKIHFLHFSQITMIKGFDYYIKVHTEGHIYLVRESLKNILTRLPKQFVRIHKSSLINLNKLKSLEPLSRGNYEVTLTTEDKLLMSKGHREKLKDLF